MKTKILRSLFFAAMYFFAIKANAQVSDQLRDSLTILLNNKIVSVRVNRIVKYDKVNDGKAFYAEREFEKNKLLDTIFIRNDSLITKYKEEHHQSWIYYAGKKHRNLYDPPGYISAAIIDLKLSIGYINQGNWEGALPAGYIEVIIIDSNNKNYSSKEFPYRSLYFTAMSNRYTNKNAKELDDEKSIISLFNMYVSQIYNGKLENFKTKANQQNKSSISEEQRKLIVQANSANGEKNYEKALELYEKSIILDEFNYPESYFNMALIASQLEDYQLAVFNMKKYLYLSPDAGDGRKALDKIYEWEFKIYSN